MMRRVAGLVVGLSFIWGVAHPCGGGSYYDVTAPLVALPSLATRIVSPSDYYETATREEVRFIHGLSLANSEQMAIVDSTMGNPGWSPTDTLPAGVEIVPMAAFDSALQRNDLAAAEREARRIVRSIFEIPTVLAAPAAGELRRAVELLDLAPVLRSAPGAPLLPALTAAGAEVRRLGPGDYLAYASAHPASPRIASIRMRALRQAYSERVPNGWAEDIRKAVPAAAWDSLLAMHEAWLHDYPAHPLAPFVRLGRVRLWYFADNRAAAWHELLALYPTAPARIAYEMRYLLLQGFQPPDGILTDASVPPEIRAALVGNLAPTRAEWSRLWAMGQQHAKERWAENLQERLLAATAEDSVWTSGGLPPEMPAYRPEASEFWRQLWAVSQLRAGHPDAALKLASSTDADSTGNTGLLLTRAHLARHEWAQAVMVPTLDSSARAYLVRVLLPDTALVALRTGSRLGAMAAYAQAERHATAGDWRAAAADLNGIDRGRSAALAQAATLAADTSVAGHLAFARWLVAHNHKVFRQYDDPVIWYRSAGWRWRALTDSTYRGAGDLLPTDLPWAARQEARGIEAMFRGSSENFHALQEYRTFFERTAAGHPQRRAAVIEANTAYRQLMDYGHAGGYWEWVLPTSAEGKAIREAGRAK